MKPQPDYFDQDAESTFKNLSEEYAKAQCSIKELDMRNKKLTEELRKEKSHVDKLKEELKRREGTKKDTGKNEALTRFNEIAGRRLLDNDASIADLSTEIRPSKIGENFKILYDNEWTEAFEELTEQGKTEEECIKTLLHIVQDTFTFAMEKAKSFESKLISIVTSFPANANSSNKNTTKDEEELIKQLKRVSAARTCTAVQDVYVRKFKIKGKIGERLKLYARKCMELCWYMAVQSPPMVIISAVQCKGPFDEKYYSRYTATGDLIDYVVWPCTLLHENGPVLAKGVAQATKDNREAFKRKQAPAAPKQNSDERWSSTKQGAVGQEGISNQNTRYQKKDEKK
ncbi:uncharacterized protein LOC134272507 [Saccostrea cucullata]|uniref:uncharacterized protein LOC134272507 n=1 Tax=Saccostrea cuccullata TaxID=36930 RepID=UPI002ED46150